MNVDKLTYPGLIVNKFEVGRRMPKADQLWDEWHDIDWKRVESYVWKLQKQIYRASTAGDSVTVHTLQKRLLRSYFAHGMRNEMLAATSGKRKERSLMGR
jgi:hypothetical protein